MPEVAYPEENLPPDDTSLHSSDELHQPLVDFAAQACDAYYNPFAGFSQRLLNRWADNIAKSELLTEVEVAFWQKELKEHGRYYLRVLNFAAAARNGFPLVLPQPWLGIPVDEFTLNTANTMSVKEVTKLAQKWPSTIPAYLKPKYRSFAYAGLKVKEVKTTDIVDALWLDGKLISPDDPDAEPTQWRQFEIEASAYKGKINIPFMFHLCYDRDTKAITGGALAEALLRVHSDVIAHKGTRPNFMVHIRAQLVDKHWTAASTIYILAPFDNDGVNRGWGFEWPDAFVPQGAASPYGFFCTRLFNQREFLMRTDMNLETGIFNWYY